MWLAPVYVIVSYLVVFFNCALAACAQAYFAGDEPNLADGFAHASARSAPILGWALLSTTVGLVLNALEQRTSWAGRIVTWIFGFAWAMGTYLVVPVLMVEDRGAFGSLRRSAQLVRDTWGDQLVAEIRFGWRGLVVFIPGVVLGVIGANGYQFSCYSHLPGSQSESPQSPPPGESSKSRSTATPHLVKSPRAGPTTSVGAFGPLATAATVAADSRSRVRPSL